MKPYLRVANVYERRIDLDDVMEMNFSEAEAQIYALRHGDILLNEGQSKELVGRPAMYRDELPGVCFTNSLVRFRAGRFVLADFALWYFLACMKTGVFSSIAKTTTNISHLGAERLASLDFPVLPLAEQRRIVAKLDAIFERTRALREKLNRSKAALDESKRAFLAAALRGNWTNHPRHSSTESSESGLWKIPSSWRWERIDTVGQIQLGRQRAPQYLTGKHTRPYLRVANIKEDRLVLDDIETMDFDPKDYDKYRLVKGDILLAEGQSPELVGESAIYDRDIEGLCYQKTLHRFRSYPERTATRFAQYVFRLYLRAGIFQSYASLTTNIAHLTLEKIKTIPFPLPPLDEQNEIVFLLDRRLGIVTRSEALITSLLHHLTHLEQSALARAFRGELVAQDPADEPASALLDRLRAERAAAAPVSKPRRGRPPAAPAPPPLTLTPPEAPKPRAKLVARRAKK